MNNNYEKITDSNNVIYENLTKIYEKIFLLKNTFNLEEDDEYEEFYNRISFYFSNILAQIKLKYIESIKVLEEKNKNNEKDILNLIMENMLLKIENEYLEEKNMLNLSNYIELKNSEKNSFENEGKEYIKNNKIRNKYSNIILEKVLKHLPEDTAKGPGYETGQYTYKERAEGRLADIVKNESPENVAIYTTLLLVALKEHFPKILADGMRIPETRAARRAFARYKALKADEQKRRAEFEKTESYRIQVLEMKAGERDHIDYPE